MFNYLLIMFWLGMTYEVYRVSRIDGKSVFGALNEAIDWPITFGRMAFRIWLKKMDKAHE